MNNMDKTIANDVKEIILTGVEGTVGLVNPLAGVALAVAGACTNKVDEIRLMYLIKALGKGLDEEKFKNMLVSYIDNSDDRAILVVDTFRKAILNRSKIAIILMGMILRDALHANCNPSLEDLIIYKALENATDYDLKIFRKMMEEEKIKKAADLDDNERLTCKWCVQNRLFDEHILDWEIEEKYTNTIVSDRLFQIMSEVPSYLWEE